VTQIVWPFGWVFQAVRAPSVKAAGAVTSGSGPTVVGLYRNEAHAEVIAARAGASLSGSR